MGVPSISGFLVSVFCLFLLAKRDAAETDTMAVGDSLTGTQTVTSSNGTFRLGFFNLNGIHNWYVGIWYARLPDRTVVWIANNDNPLKNNSCTFNLSGDGSLMLSYGQAVIWSTNATLKASSAVLSNAGNLIVHGTVNKSEVIWQSFDNPGNTWLPGMKFSARQRLSAWKSPCDPTAGLYNFQIDPSGANQFVLIWKNTTIYWESGVWNGNIFSNVPALSKESTYDYKFTFFDNGTYKYFTYSVNTPALARIIMSETGDVRVENLNKWGMFSAAPAQCQVYALCGAYGSCNQNNLQFCSCSQGFQPRDEGRT